MTKEIPLIFNPDSVGKILSGEKTVTRRLKFNGKEGDLIWVRHPFRKLANNVLGYPIIMDDFTGIEQSKQKNGKVKRTKYISQSGSGNIWKSMSPIFLPKWAAVIWLRVVDVRHEPLSFMYFEAPSRYEIIVSSSTDKEAQKEGFKTLTDFISAWDKMYPDTPFKSEPFVYRVEFERIKP